MGHRISLPATALLLAAAIVFAGFTGDAAAHPASRGSIEESPARAPTGPPLTAGPSALPAAEESAAQPVEESDPLVGNGLVSPVCSDTQDADQLPAPARNRCEVSGFIAAAAPTGGYGIDVHIDTGLFGLSSGGLLSAVQDMFVSPLWTAVLWSVHAVLSMLEWSLTIDLLGGPALNGVTETLRRMQASLTLPLLSGALAVAAVLAAWSGLVRRRFAESAADLLTSGLMLLVGLWVIADPSATIGAVAATVDRASLSVFTLPSSGGRGDPKAAFAEGLAEVFAQAVEGPWCYLEFGSVAWCQDGSRIDPRLRRAALAIARRDEASEGCPGPRCTSGSAPARSARMIREARTNGGLFLALPANGPDRNAINSPGSLLHVLCQSYEATRCHGPTAAEAEFRTDAGTWPRVAGLLLIVAGVAGMLLLVGVVVVRLLTAALLALVLLLLAPAVVLCPAFGDRGRALFSRWALHLAGAVASKLLCALILGVLFAAAELLQQLSGLGWWTQWLTTAAFWWGALFHRHALRGLAWPVSPPGARGRPRVHAFRGGVAAASVRLARRQQSWPPPAASPAAGLERVPAPASSSSPAREDPAAAKLVAHDVRAARATLDDASVDLAARQGAEQLGRLTDALEHSRSDGNARRAARLAHRRDRVATSLAGRRDAREQARATLRASERAAAPGGDAWRAELIERRGRYLDEQASLPAARLRGQRDYPSLAPLVGYGETEYRNLPPARRRQVRAAVDRELAARPLPAPDSVSPPAEKRAPEDPPQYQGVPLASESPLLRDVMEVAAGRKRTLGYGNP